LSADISSDLYSNYFVNISLPLDFDKLDSLFEIINNDIIVSGESQESA